MAALEILINSHAIANLIREGKTYQIPSTMQTSGQSGMITFESAIRKLVKEGKISKEAMDNFLGHSLTGKNEKEDSQNQSGPQKRPGAAAQNDGGVKITSSSNRPSAMGGGSNLFGFKKKSG